MLAQKGFDVNKRSLSPLAAASHAAQVTFPQVTFSQSGFSQGGLQAYSTAQQQQGLVPDYMVLPPSASSKLQCAAPIVNALPSPMFANITVSAGLSTGASAHC